MSEKSVIKFLNKRLLFVCLGLSVVLWFFTSLSEAYEHDVVCEVQYVNLPANLIPVFPLTHTIQLKLFGTGFDLLKLSRSSRRQILVDYQLFDEKEQISQEELRNLVGKQLGQFQIENIRPNDISFIFQEEYQKKIPIRLHKEITTSPTYFLADSIRLIPDSLLVSGPKELIDTLKSWPTRFLKLNNLENDQTGTIDLMNPEVFNLAIEPAQCNYAVTLDQWTEKTMDLPISSINLPDSLLIFLFPKQANVRFQVPLKQYELVQESQFRVVADFEKTQILKEKKVVLKLQTDQTSIQNVRIEPKLVEFVVSMK